MPRPPIPTRLFVLVLLRHDGRYLLVRERKHGQTWYLPAGAVEPGEDLASAAVRETLEEAGVRPRLTGLVRIEHGWHVVPGELPVARLRYVFVADVGRATEPKRFADQHSLGAAWVRPAEIPALDLRHPEVMWLVDAVERGAPVLPLSGYVGEALRPELASWAD